MLQENLFSMNMDKALRMYIVSDSSNTNLFTLTI